MTHTSGIIRGADSRCKQLKNFDYASFKAKCLKAVGDRLTNDALLQHIQQMYFDNNALLKTSPEFLLLGRQRQEAAPG